MLRKAMMVMTAAVLCGLVAPQAASAGYHYGWEYGAGWGEGVVYGPGYYTHPHPFPAPNYPYEGYPYIGYDGPPFFIVGDNGWDCSVWHRPGHRGWRSRTAQLCE
jgi:hypothetical protein